MRCSAASAAPSSTAACAPGRRRWRAAVTCSASNRDAAAVAVETVAAAALRMRLKAHEVVHVGVECTGWDLLGGRIQGARLEGRGWETPQGLQARVLEIAVGRVELDLPAVLSQQRILLRNVPIPGSARVVFNAADFGSFLNHDMVAAAARTAVQGRPFQFDRTGVSIHPATPSPSRPAAGPPSARTPAAAAPPLAPSAGGLVLFSGTLPASGRSYRLSMRPVSGGRAVQVVAVPQGANCGALWSTDSAGSGAEEPWAGQGEGRLQQQQRAAAAAAGQQAAGALDSYGGGVTSASFDLEGPGAAPGAAAAAAEAEAEAALVSRELSRFFSRLMVDLGGVVELTFDSMRVTGGEGARRQQAGPGPAGQPPPRAEPLLELGLRASVLSFPPLSLQF